MKSMQGKMCGTGASGLGLMLAAGLASPAAAVVDKSWHSDSGQWTEAASWLPLGVPQTTDRVFIGNLAGVQNATVALNQNDTVAAMFITDGMTFRTDDDIMQVNGDVSVSGSNIVMGPGGVPLVYASRLLVESTKATSFLSDNISLTDGARMDLVGQAFARHDGTMTIDSTSRLSGRGYVDCMGGGTTLVNEGRIVGGDWPGVHIRQFGGGNLNLDGLSGNGVLDLDNASNATIRLQGTSLSDHFDGAISMGRNSDLNVELSEGWTVGNAGVVTVNAHGDTAAPSRIRGGAMAFAGELNVVGDDAHVHFTPSTLTLEPSANVIIGQGGLVEIGAAADTETIVNGGTYTLAPQANLRFFGPTTLHAGVFHTTNDLAADGFVQFSGPTAYAGTVTIQGIARQLGDATVSSSSVINADRFDMDGTANHAWSIGAGLVINAGGLDENDNTVGGVLTIAGGLTANLTVNLPDPTASWIMNGTLNLGGAGALFITRIAGAQVFIGGHLNVTSGRPSIGAPVSISDSDVGIGDASSILRLNNTSIIYPTVTFAGAGSLQNGPLGDMTILSGVSTAGIGLVNQGVMRVGEEAGIAAVDRLQTSGTWEVEIGGYAAGAEHDRLIVSGGAATIGGVLVVDVIDGFQPVMGDTFTILTAVGGVNGAFPAEAVSMAGGYTYEWTVLASANDVRLRLDGVIPPPCIADFNGDGVVNSQDFFDFLARFFAADPLADFNSDGVVNSQDFFDFLTDFFKGCH